MRSGTAASVETVTSESSDGVTTNLIARLDAVAEAAQPDGILDSRRQGTFVEAALIRTFRITS